MGQTIYQVDAFTERPFAGNPAAVAVLSSPAEDWWMRAVAREMNLSETAFLHRLEGRWAIRWFTPAIEVDLCGHATLASAHILWEHGFAEPGQVIRFSSKSGLLAATRRGDWIELDFPGEPDEEVAPPARLVEAMGLTPTYTGRNRFDYLLEVDSEETVRSLKPDFSLLDTVTTRGVIVTAKASSPGYDFVSRFFTPPRTGLTEDPATGSAHCCLGPFWKRRTGKSEFVAYQASARGGVVRVRVRGDRVDLGGQAITVLKGELI